MSKFKVGEHVSALDEDISGVVSKIEGDSISVETLDGFAMQFEARELIKLGGKQDFDRQIFSENLHEIISEKEAGKPKKSVRVKPKERFEAAMEVDLHIHQLVKSTKYMANHEMLNIQLDTAKHKLEYAIKNRIQKIVFIHGVGEGVLRMELEYLFNRYENLKYYDANYQKYGLGATEVYIFQNSQ